MRKKQPKPAKLIESFFKDIASAKGSPRLQIIITSGYLEVLVNALTEQKCKNKSVSNCNYGLQLIILNESKIIADEPFTYLNAFKALRNDAAHIAQFVLTPEMVAPFKNLLKWNKIPQLLELKDFNVICHTLLAGFWNTHIEVFYPYFEPERYEANKAERERHKLIIDSLRQPIE